MLYNLLFLFIRRTNTVDITNLLHTFIVTCDDFLEKTSNFVSITIKILLIKA